MIGLSEWVFKLGGTFLELWQRCVSICRILCVARTGQTSSRDSWTVLFPIWAANRDTTHPHLSRAAHWPWRCSLPNERGHCSLFQISFHWCVDDCYCICCLLHDEHGASTNTQKNPCIVLVFIYTFFSNVIYWESSEHHWEDGRSTNNTLRQ